MAAPRVEGAAEDLTAAAAAAYADLRLVPVLRALLAHTGRRLDVSAGSVSLVEAGGQRYAKVAERGAACGLGHTFPLDEGVTGQVVARRAPVTLGRYDEVRTGHLPTGHPARRGAVAAVPIWWRGEVIGANVLFAAPDRRFSAADLDRLELLTQVSAPAIVQAGTADPSLAHLLRHPPRPADRERVVTTAGPARPVDPAVAALAADLVALVEDGARGRPVRVAVVYRPEGLRLLVHDGHESEPSTAAHLGDGGWPERVDRAGAGVVVQQVPGWGTLLRADVPYSAAGRTAGAPAPTPSPLTRREQEVLVLVARGLSDREVAGALVLSRKTVEKHVSAVLRKTGARARTGAVVHALQQGWLAPEGLPQQDPL